MLRSLAVSAALLVTASCSTAPAPEATRPLAAQTPATGDDKRPGIAVFPFENGGSYGEKKEDFSLLPLGLQRQLMRELAANTNLRVIDRTVLRELMAEQDLGASGRVTPETAARLGRMVGAKYVLTGSFTDMFGEFQLTGLLLNTETTEVVKSGQSQGKREDFYKLVVRMAADVTKSVKLPELSNEVREARVKQSVPIEALARYSMITSLQDEGKTDRAIQLYRDLVRDFPQNEEWKQELRQLTGG